MPSKPPSHYRLFSRSVLSNSLLPHGLQHARLPCLSLFPGVAQTQVHWVGDAIQPSHPLSPPLLLPSIFPSIRVFSSELVLHIRWPKYWSFSISPSNEYSGLISFRTDWFDFHAIQGILKSLLQHHSLKASFLQCSAFLMVQLTPIVSTGKIIALMFVVWTAKGCLCFLIHCLGFSKLFFQGASIF